MDPSSHFVGMSSCRPGQVNRFFFLLSACRPGFGPIDPSKVTERRRQLMQQLLASLQKTSERWPGLDIPQVAKEEVIEAIGRMPIVSFASRNSYCTSQGN